MKNKKFIVILTAILLLSFIPGCASMKINNILKGLKEDEMDCPAYDLEKYTANYWDSDVIYNEAIMPLKEKDGSIKPIPLLYKAEKVLAVRDHTLNILYKEGKDYILEDGFLVIPEGSSIHTVDYTEYYPDKDYKGPKLNRANEDGYILWCDSFNMHQMQTAVTYLHLDKWNGTVPPKQGGDLPITLSKLENKEPVKILIYGDSIATGCDSSSSTGDEPFAPRWFEMMEASLKVKYGYDDIKIINTAAGGTDSAWGAQNAYDNCKVIEPDLAIIAYGMNDINTEVNDFVENIRQIMDTTSLGNYDCEFILVSTMLANPEAANFYGNQVLFREALKNADFKMSNHIVIADMTTLYEDLLSHKRYWDMSCNNINHPNDFLARAYTQLMLQTLNK